MFGKWTDWGSVFQILCAASVLYGIAQWSIPSAFIVGGLTGIAVVHIRSSK